MRYFYGLLLILLLFGGISLFNSCSQGFANRASILRNSLASKVPTASDDSLSSESKLNAQKKDDDKEFNYFPYDLQLDTMAYLSCKSNRVSFNFKTGAFFSRSGLRLSEYFLRKSKELNDKDLEDLIRTSTKRFAQPQLHFAPVQNLLSAFGTSDQLPVLVREISGLVKNKQTRTQKLNGSQIEFSMRHSQFHLAVPARADDLRLVMLYLNNKDNSSVIYNTKNNSFVSNQDFYGRVYELDFTQKYTDRYVLNNVKEKKYPQHNNQGEWHCPSELVFTIRRPDDFVEQSEPDNGEEDDSSDTNEKEKICPDSSRGGNILEIVKKVLDKNNWNINIEKKCISPKRTNIICYPFLYKNRGVIKGLRTNNPPIYAKVLKNSSCTAGYNDSNYQICPHHLSICVRNNN